MSKTGTICALLIVTAVPLVAHAADRAGELNLLARVTWGATPASAEQIRAMGMQRWLDWQLHPTAADTLPLAAQAEIEALPISHRSMLDFFEERADRLRVINPISDPAEKQAAQQAFQQWMSDVARQAAARNILRDLYSPAQLREQMTWFWFNHFNVHQYKNEVRLLLPDYEEQALRPNALGKFRDLLSATLHHPAMLQYLDNAANGVGHINENYAREIMELHTMGVGAGYTQTDVQELARVLTGLGIDARPEDPKLKPDLQSQLVRNGLFEFNPARHDYGDKVFLGQTIKGRGLAEADQVVDILARQPATARHISLQLAQFFVADTPPPGLVDAMAQVFLKTDGDVALVLQTMFRSPAFAASLGQKFKDPVHYALSAVRLAYGDKIILNTIPIQNWLNRLAEGLYNHETPDGYALGSASWSGPGQLAVRFEVARQIGFGSAGLFKPPEPGAVDHPAFPQLQNALYYDGLRSQLGPKTLAALDQAVSPQDWNLLFLCSPEFMY